MRTNSKHLLSACSALFCAILCVQTTQGAQLVDIRTGYHTTFARLVLEFNAPVFYTIDHDSNAVTVTVQSIQDIRNWYPRRYQVKNPIIENFVLEYPGTDLRLRIHTFSQHIQVFNSYLKSPTRIVLDIFTSDQKPLAVKPLHERPRDMHSQAKESTSAPNKEAPDPTRQDSLDSARAPQQPAEKSDVAELLEGLRQTQTLTPATQPPPKTQAKPSGGRFAGESRVALFVFILAAFLIIDALLVTFYLLHRSEKSKSVASARTAKAASNKNDFKDILVALNTQTHASEAPTSRNSDNPATENLHLEERIQPLVESLAKALITACRNRSLFRIPTTSDRENETATSTARLPKDIWIGQDGFQFLQKLKKVNLN